MDIQEQLISTIVDSIQDKKGSKIIVADLTVDDHDLIRRTLFVSRKEPKDKREEKDTDNRYENYCSCSHL